MSNVDVLRAVLANSPVPAVTLDDAIDPERAAGVRAAVAGAGLEPTWIADRGRYQVNRSYRDEALFALLRAVTSEIVGRPLRPTLRAVWTRLVHRDYSLGKDDHLQVQGLPPHIDVTLDLSEAILPGEAQLVYQAAQGQLVCEQWPGRLSIVDRRRVEFFRWEKYLSLHVGEASVWRLRLSFTEG